MNVFLLEICKNWLSQISELHRNLKITIQILVDIIISLISFAMALFLGNMSLNLFVSPTIFLELMFSTICMIVFFVYSGLYKSMVRFISVKILKKIFVGVLLCGFCLLLSNIFIKTDISNAIIINFIILLLLLTSGARFVVRQIFQNMQNSVKKRTVIYGAGQAGRALKNALLSSPELLPIAFIDDDITIHGMAISGCRVYSKAMFNKLHLENHIELLLLALPRISIQRRREIIESFKGIEIEIKSIPSMSEILNSGAQIYDLRSITPDMLLGRDAVPPIKSLIEQNIVGKTVLVTGAGGSIGSELCEQVLNHNPKNLILLEHSELALYQINEQIQKMKVSLKSSSVVVAILGSVCDKKCVDNIFQNFEVETIYHAAAYKQVPLVEENVVGGILNNIFGTLTLVRCASRHGIKNFTLISTDKAVRPTNVMGASKRFAELICQAYAAETTNTKFSMVRFGNVLGSSGSVIPHFQKQIEAGGPVTVTDPEITRYFMTIREAAELVLQASAMTSGGDVFLLDMGEPIKISDLASEMIKLTGSKPYFLDNTSEKPQGSNYIGICFIGLRKGEKLYEELLVDENSEPTEHPFIMKAHELSLPIKDLNRAISEMREACNCHDTEALINILKSLPLGFNHNENSS